MASPQRQIDCSELAVALSDIARNISARSDVATFEDVVARMNELLPDVTRSDIVDGIVAVDRAQRADQTKAAQTLWTKIKRGARTEVGLQDDIGEIDRRLKEGLNRPERKKAQVARTKAEQELRKMRDSLKREEALRGQIDKMIATLQSGNFGPPASPKRRTKEAEFEALETQRAILRAQIRHRVSALKPRTFFQRFVRSPFRFLGSLITTGEFSGVLNQGGFVAFGHPAMAFGAYKKALTIFRSRGGEVRAEQAMNERPNRLLYQRAKLFIATSTDTLTQREEAAMSTLFERVPILAAFTRFHRGYLNELRADTFDMLIEGLGRNGEVTIEEARAIANFVNAATGRGKLGQLEQSAILLADMAFAPRFYASRIQMLMAEPLWGSVGTTPEGRVIRPTNRVRKAVIAQYARYAVGIAVVNTLLALAGGILERDPRSSDFLKARFGRARIQILSGFQQFTTFASRLISGEYKSIRSGEVRPIRGEDLPYGGFDTSAVVFQFLRSKSSPLMRPLVDIATGQDFLGRPMTLKKLALQFAGPITYRDIYDLMVSEELSIPSKVAFSILGVHGAFVNVHTDEEVKSKSVRSLRARPRTTEPASESEVAKELRALRAAP